MIDLSFLTDEEQEAILKVLQRDAELKRAEEERIRHLPEKVQDDNQIKNMSGQWFYEAKSKRHRDKIHGADIIRASMRRKPLTIAELNQNKSGKKKNSWVNNVNKEVFMPPELFGAIEDTEGELKSSPSPAVLGPDSSILAMPQEDTKKASSSKERTNPFNNSDLSEDDTKSKRSKPGTSCSSETSKKDILLSSIENQSEVNVTNSRLEEPERTSVEPNEPHKQAGKPPVPKARKNIHKLSDVSVKSDDSFPRVPSRIKQSSGHSTPPRGILKRNSSSSSTDSEVLRLNQIVDPSNKNGLPASTIHEGIAEKNSPPGREPDGFSQNSLDRLKQVRFSSSVSRKERPPSLELHEGKESGEFSLLDSDYMKTSDNQTSGLVTCQKEQTAPIKPLAFHSTDLNGHTEDQAVSKERTADLCSYNANGSSLPSDVLQSQKNPSAECRTSNETFPKVMKKPSGDEIKPEIKTEQRSPEPDVSQSSTGQQLPLAKTGDSQAPSVVSVDLEQGKPSLAGGLCSKTPSKSDKHAAEALKAADESITKVLDWFKRSSSTDSDGTLSSSVSQGREPSEGMSRTKTRELAVTGEEDDSSRDVLNQDRTLHVRKELTDKDPQFRDGGNHPETLSLVQTGYPSHLLLEEQRFGSQSEEGEMADLSDQRFKPLQITGQGTNNADETYFGEGADGERKSEGENSARRETKVDERVKPSLRADSPGKERRVENCTLGDGKRNVKPYVKEGEFEHQAGVLLEEPEGRESGFLEKGLVQQDMNANRGNLLHAQQQEIKRSSPTGDQRRIKDIRAFWEREQTSPRLGNKEDVVNENASVSKVVHRYSNGASQLKPTSESSGYVTGESDNEQGKYNLVAFRRVELSDDSEPKDDDINLSLGSIRPEPIDKFKEGCVDIRSVKTLPRDWKSTEFTKSLEADKLQPRHNATYSSKKDGGLQIGALAKDQTSSAPQLKPNFTIHSLKEKTDEESKSEMLNPLQFQSLRSFWNVGVQPQSRTEEPKEKRIPRSNSIGTYQRQSKEIKGFRTGTGQAVLEEEQKSQITQGFLKATPNQPHPPLLANVMPTESLQCVSKEDRCSEEPAVSKCMETMRLGKEVKEYIEKTVVPSKMQSSLCNSGLQKLLTQTFQDPLPVDLLADETGAPKETEGQMLCTDGTVQHGAVSDSNVRLSTNEIAETVHRTLVPPKGDTDSFNAGIERLIKEASAATTFSDCSITVSSSKQPTSPLEERSFYNKVIQLSRDAYPGDQTKRDVAPQNLEKDVCISGQHIRFKTREGAFPKETEDLNSAPQRALDQEGNQMYRDDISSRENALLIPSPDQILPDARLAVLKTKKPPGKEVSETVTESSVPLKRESHDLSTRLLVLLKESSELPSVSCATESILKTAFGSIPGEDRQRSYKQVVEASALPSPPVASLSRQTSSETTERSDDASRRMQREPNGETAMGQPFANQKSIRSQSSDQSNRDGTSVGELVEPQPEEVAETVVETVKPSFLQQTRLKDSFKKLLKEDPEVLCRDIEFPKPVHASLHPNQSINTVDDKSVPSPQEINESVEKATVPSNSIYGELKINFQKLLMDDMESLPSSQKRTNSNKVEGMTGKESESLVSQQGMGHQEIKETVNKTIVPPKLPQSEFNSGLQKLFAEVSLQQLGGETKEKMQAGQGMEEAMDVSQDSVVKSLPPAGDTVFNSCSGKLMKKDSNASSHLSKNSSQEVLNDSTYQSENESLLVTMPTLRQESSNGYRTEVRIPLKRKPSKQDGQVLADAKIPVVPLGGMLFQKTVQVKQLSTEVPSLEKEEGSPTFARAEERETGYGAERDAGDVSRSSATLDVGSENMDVLPGSQRTSTPLVEQESPPTISQFERSLASCHDEDDEDEDARSFGSDLSNESISSLSGIKRRSICSEEEPNPVLEALKRSSNRQIPSKSLEDIPSATSNKGKVNAQKEELMLSAEDGQKAGQPHELPTTTPGISTAPSFPVNQFSNPEKVKRMSKSVPAFLQEESDDRDTDTASDSSYPLGRIKKSPSSLTNLSGSSGLASLSSVSTSVMSVYSGDFGNVDVQGNIQFAIDYVEQLKELHVFIAQCKDLAVADVKKQRSDPYVKSYLLPEKYKLGKRKTSVKKKTLNPVYNEILRYKVDKALLTSQRLNVSVWHNDIFGRNSFLGEVELDLGMWDWNDKQNKQMIWYPLKPRAPLAALDLVNRGEMKLALQYIPQPAGGKKTPATGEVHIWVKECSDLPILRGNKLNSFVKCTILPDTSRKSRQKTRAVTKTTNPVFNHTMVYDGFKPEDLKEACVELTVWDHNKLVNHFLGGLRIGLGTGQSYGTAVDWMDSTLDETSLWERMMSSPDQWVEDTLPLRMLTIAKMTK